MVVNFLPAIVIASVLAVICATIGIGASVLVVAHVEPARFGHTGAVIIVSSVIIVIIC